MVDEKHVLDLVPAYALGCLDEAERTLVTEHLADCTLCQDELRAYQHVATHLPLALTQVKPPKRLKEELMRTIAEGKQQVLSRQSDSSWERLNTWLRGNSLAVGLAGLAVIVVLAISNLLLWQRVNLSNQSELPVISMQGTENAVGAAGTIIMSRNGNRGALVVDGLPVLEPGLQYQLWLIKDGERDSGGVFSVRDDGYGVLYVKSSRPLSDFDSFGITIEPEGGSPAPTGDKVMGGG